MDECLTFFLRLRVGSRSTFGRSRCGHRILFDFLRSECHRFFGASLQKNPARSVHVISLPKSHLPTTHAPFLHFFGSYPEQPGSRNNPSCGIAHSHFVLLWMEDSTTEYRVFQERNKITTFTTRRENPTASSIGLRRHSWENRKKTVPHYYHSASSGKLCQSQEGNARSVMELFSPTISQSISQNGNAKLIVLARRIHWLQLGPM